MVEIILYLILLMYGEADSCTVDEYYNLIKEGSYYLYQDGRVLPFSMNEIEEIDLNCDKAERLYKGMFYYQGENYDR